MWIVLLFAAGLVLANTSGLSYEREIVTWRAAYEQKLKATGGWLSVSGLFWLHEGANTVGSDPHADVILPEGTANRAGVLRMGAGAVTFKATGAPGKLLKPDEPGPPDVLNIGRVALTIIKRGDKKGVRLKDPEAATRREFTGCKWFPAANNWRMKAKWVPYTEPHTIAILNILGMTTGEQAPGYAEFTYAGKQLRLEPIVEEDHLFFLFKDRTSGVTTYPAGRFLYAAMPKDGFIDLDFNKSENPPCAFTAFATCPLPPKQNALPVAIMAGEKTYGHH